MAFCPGKGRAITIDFDADYTSSALLETMPTSGTKWTRGADADDTNAAIKVASDAGVDRQQAVITCVSTDPSVTSANYYFEPSSTDLDGTFNSNTSIVDYSFSMALQSNPGTYTGNIAQVSMGIPNAAFIWVTGEGLVTAGVGNGTGGKTAIALKTSMGGSTKFVALGGVYFTVSGQLNYATKTFTVFLDGVAQTTGGPTATTNFPFATNTSNSPEFTLSNQNAYNTGWMATTFSHFFYELDPVWSGPIVITAGGTYSGNWASTDPNTSTVTINTTSPVTIQNSRIKGAFHCISNLESGKRGAGSVERVNLTVTNCKGYGLNPNVSGEATGCFIWLYCPSILIATNNYLESTAGMQTISGNGEKVDVSYNYAFNIDGRFSDGSGGYLANDGVTPYDDDIAYSSFFQIQKCYSLPSAVIAWNKVVEIPNESSVEDSIAIYYASGTSADSIKIYDNYVQGGYRTPVDAANSANASNSGTGINCGDGGDGDTLSTCSAYVSAYDNVVVNYANAGMAIFDGHDISITDNRVYSSGVAGLGTPIRNTGGAGLDIFDLYDTGSGVFFNDTASGNLCGWANSAHSVPYTVPGGDYDYNFTYTSSTPNYYDPAGPGANTWYDGATTAAVEQTQVNYFYGQVQSNNITIGPNF